MDSLRLSLTLGWSLPGWSLLGWSLLGWSLLIVIRGFHCIWNKSATLPPPYIKLISVNVLNSPVTAKIEQSLKEVVKCLYCVSKEMAFSADIYMLNKPVRLSTVSSQCGRMSCL